MQGTAASGLISCSPSRDPHIDVGPPALWSESTISRPRFFHREPSRNSCDKMPLYPSLSITPFAQFPARLQVLSITTPFLLHEALTPLFLLFLTLLVFPYKSFLRNAIALPVIIGLYIRLTLVYSSSHWGLAFCVGAGAYFGSLQAFNLLVVKDVGRDEDVQWTIDDTKPQGNDSYRGNGTTNRGAHGTNGEAKKVNSDLSPTRNGSTNGIMNGPTKHAVRAPSPGLGYPALESYPLRQRARFTFSLLCASRGVGFKFQVRRVKPPPLPSDSHLSFLVTHFSYIFVTYIILDTFGYHLAHDPFFYTPGCWKTPFHPSPLSQEQWTAICAPDFVPQNSTIRWLYHNIARKYLSLFAVYAILSQLYSIAAILFTTPIPVTAPSSWAPLFGPVCEATSLRGFWTVFWHSIFKKGFSYPGEWVAYKILGLERQNMWAQVIVMFAAFWNSAALHGVGAWTASGRGIAAAGFFVIQSVGFLVEMIIVKAFRASGIDEKGVLGKVVTFTWMTVWGLWSCEVFFYDFLLGGVAGSEPVAWSTWRWWTGEGEPYRWGPSGEWMRWDQNSLGGWGVRV
ncbi:hypothetical protein TWF730_007474 [Orbilia blumenaviensis]|uniref:Wax synthase domain-containing protein n=1 Tax=Orbilia blumenaviensis TaxID=1796055 RepID=A0AAV9V8H0_9PEZI